MTCSNHVDETEGVRPCARCARPYCADCLVAIQGRPYCAACKGEKLLDLQSGSDRSILHLASMARRIAAQVLDSLIFTVPILAAFGAIAYISFHGTKNPSEFFVLALMALVVGYFFGYIAYEALFLGWRGQTLGKIATRIRVVRPDGTPISRGQAWGRSLTRGVLIHVLSLINYLPAFFTEERTCVHDMAAKTRVVNVD
jgi:uncharacterized RDD family membrane protein YckC